jgi:succinate-semialdehyde dehydrogenase/glutarate-semialdehyde dehydrogenase
LETLLTFYIMIESVNPYTEQIEARYARMTQNEVFDLLQEAQAACRDWAEVAVNSRAAKLKEVAAILDERKDSLAELMTQEMGKPIQEARSEIEKCAWVCRYYAENGAQFLADEPLDSDASESYLHYQPLGLVLAVMPWNFPFWQVFRFAAPMLTAGNGGILKHASNVSGCALAIEKIFRDAGYPEHLFRTLLIDSDQVGGVIARPEIAAVTLTGSEQAGASVAEAAGRAIKKSVLELGGSDPYLVLADADLELAAEKCAQSRMINSGQSCIAAKRFLVESSVHDAFVDQLIDNMAAYEMGDPGAESTQLGPLARGDLRDSLHAQVIESVEQGAALKLGGQIPNGEGYFYPATVLSGVKPGMPAFDQELFGPVAAVIEVADQDEALRLANQSQYGLGSGVFSGDVERAKAVARRIESGCCFINDFVKSDPRLPFGGIKRSGYGRELSKLGIREFVNIQTVSVA